MSNQTSGAVSGAAQGAAVGTMIMPGWGTAIGAVVGAVWGGVTGGMQDRAQFHLKKARKFEQERTRAQAGLSQREMMRNFRQQRAHSIAMVYAEAGGGESSAGNAAISSIGTQFAGNKSVSDWDYYKQALIEKQRKRAGKKMQQAGESQAMMQGVASLASTVGGMYGASQAAGTQAIVTQQSRNYTQYNQQFGNNFQLRGAPVWNGIGR